MLKTFKFFSSVFSFNCFYHQTDNIVFEANNLPNDVQNLTGSTAEIYKIVGDLGRLAEGLLCDYRLVAYCFRDLTMNPIFCLLSVIFFAVYTFISLPLLSEQINNDHVVKINAKQSPTKPHAYRLNPWYVVLEATFTVRRSHRCLQMISWLKSRNTCYDYFEM